MKADYYISITLDTRRELTNKKYPVRLRVYTPVPRKQKLYPTIFELTEKDYESVWRTTKPRNEHKKLRGKIQALLTKADKVAEELKPFTFEHFERKMYRKSGDGVNVRHLFNEVIQEKRERNRIGSVDAYKNSMNSLSGFAETKQSFNKLTLYEITPSWLNDYEKYMVEDNGRSITTVGMYLRALRAVYNMAIDEGEIDREFYPFGKRKYVIPTGKNTKKALGQEQLRALYNAKAETPEQEKARDFWFFSYACNGMNIKDIALLRYENISDGRIEFSRAKTLSTSKGSIQPITVHLNPFSQGIIDKYGNGKVSARTYVFNIIDESMSPEQQHTKTKGFTRFINQHIKTMCVKNGLPGAVSVYWARHSYATKLIRDGASMEFVQEHLGHGNIKTTQNYFAGYDNDTKKEFAHKIMDLD
jgi:site-specific recombinase XerD